MEEQEVVIPSSAAADLPEEDFVLQEETSQEVYHPLMTTPFEEYTVTEGLLLLILLLAFLAGMVKVLRGGLSWLLS